MANRTIAEAISIHGTNPQYLVEKIIRTRIYDSLYWKESCFGLTGEYCIQQTPQTAFLKTIQLLNFTRGLLYLLKNLAATVLDKAIEINSIGGQYGPGRPTEFICLTLKLLQLQPDKQIVIEYIRNEDFK